MEQAYVSFSLSNKDDDKFKLPYLPQLIIRTLEERIFRYCFYKMTKVSSVIYM